LRVSASAASTSGGLGLLLLEDSAEKSSVVISASTPIGQVVGAIDKLNRDPEGTAVILAAASTDTGDITGYLRGSSRQDVGCSQTAGTYSVEAVWQHIVLVDTALARRGNTLFRVRVQAEDVEGHGGLMPEVHEDSEVVWVRTSSMYHDGLDGENLIHVDGRVTVSCPDDVGSIVRENLVAAVSTEDGVPAGSSGDQI